MTTGSATGTLPICLVLSTGRCGSTMVSNIVNAHPMALSVSELFSGLRDHDLTEREMSGPEFWDMLSTPCQTDMAGLRCRIKLDEMLYPAFDPRPGANRFTWATGLPPLLQACIPHLTDRPDDMYASLEAAAADQPRRLLSEHLRWLFGVLAQSQVAAGRDPRIVVERSGGSLTYASALLRMFPEARIVHLFRDGRECAVSMSRHGRYKMAMIRAALWAGLGYDPYADAGGPPSGGAGPLGDELAGLTPDRITRARYDRYEVPLSRYGGMWTKMIVDGLAELGDRPRVLTLDYGELVANPAATIGTLLDFLGLTRDPLLEEQMAAQVRPARDVRGEVGEEQWQELTRTCRLGMNRLYGRNNWK
jgi:putative sulfotransferase